MTTPTARATWYPEMPPMLDGETVDAYTDRLTGAFDDGRGLYDHDRYRQCAVGYHHECSTGLDVLGVEPACGCPCHIEESELTWLLGRVVDTLRTRDTSPLKNITTLVDLRIEYGLGRWQASIVLNRQLTTRAGTTPYRALESCANAAFRFGATTPEIRAEP